MDAFAQTAAATDPEQGPQHHLLISPLVESSQSSHRDGFDFFLCPRPYRLPITKATRGVAPIEQTGVIEV